MAHVGRLDAILAALPPEDAALISGLAEPPWKARARRLDARDAAIRRAAETLTGESAYSVACELSRRLSRYLAGSGWALDARDGVPDGAPELRRALYDIAQHGEARTLGWRQILKVTTTATR